MKRKRITLKGYFTLIVFMFILISCIGVATGKSINNQPEFVEITVKNGQTLWQIADMYDNNKIDIRKFIYDIKKINNISKDNYIYPGQQLKVPILD